MINVFGSSKEYYFDDMSWGDKFVLKEYPQYIYQKYPNSIFTARYRVLERATGEINNDKNL